MKKNSNKKFFLTESHATKIYLERINEVGAMQKEKKSKPSSICTKRWKDICELCDFGSINLFDKFFFPTFNLDVECYGYFTFFFR